MYEKNISFTKESYMKYFIVKAMCGHVGRGMYIEKAFPITASTGREAAQTCKAIPRVKHDNKRAILSVREVSYDEYRLQQKINNDDPYFQAKSRRDYFAAGLSYEDCKPMTDIAGATKENRKSKYDDYCFEKGKHRTAVQLCCEKMSWKEIYYEIGYAM